jgi:hypothetical protein
MILDSDEGDISSPVHNLWPFEVLGAVVLAGAALGGLTLLRVLAGRSLGREKLP